MIDRRIAVLSSTVSSLVAIAVATAPANAANVVVASGTTVTGQQSIGGTDTLTVQAGGAITSASDPAVTEKNAATGVVITNDGTIQSTASGGRAINVSGSALPRTITLNNAAGALITSQDDAFRVNLDVSQGTITVNNAGTIKTTNGGQGIDFDAITTPGATVTINNLAGGVIQTFGADGIRSGQGSVIDNAGTIFADGVLDDSNDGIDMQAHTATVINEATGTISGERHGITSSTGLTVTNFGSITGRNGSGVGSDGNGTVVNFGTITGAYNGVSANGDGDGVDIDFIANITNSGVIQGTGAAGVDKGGNPNSSEGIAIGGGTVVNNAGALVSGQGNGILVDDGAGGSAAGATSITNAGTIRGVTGAAITLVGNFNDTIVNSGTISGGNGVAISMGAGNDQLTLLPGSTIVGSVDGGDGTDQVTLAGTGFGRFAGATNFEHLDVASGNWTLTGASTFANGTSIDAGASLTGSAAVLTGSILDNGALIVDQPTDGAFTASLGGTGLLEKTGAGVLTIGSQSFTGRTDVIDGTLLLNGTLPSAVTVEQGARLAGTGQIASATINAGGTIAPGIGTLAVAGNFTQQAGSTFAATILPGAIASRISVGGTATIGDGATITVARGAGDFVIGTRYLLLTAAGGITGTYTLDQTAVDGTELRLVTDGTDVFADLARTGASLQSLAINRNQANAAAVFGSLDVSNAAFAALTLDPSDAGVRNALSQLSGEIHASVRTAMVHDAMLVDDAAISRIETGAAQPAGLWAQILGNYGEDDGTRGAADTRRTTYGGIGGYDITVLGGLRAGVAGGYTHTKLSIDARDSSARLRTGHVLAYAGGAYGALRVRAGIGYDWGKIDTQRAVAFSGFSDQDDARYDGNTLHGFGELGYALPLGGGTVQPFVGGSAYRVHTDGFSETGGAAALDGQRRTDSVQFSDVGLKIETPVVDSISVHAGVAWQHAFGSIDPDAFLSFAGTAASFEVTGASLSRDAAAPSAEIAWQPTPKLRVSAGYNGLIGRAGADNAGRLTLGVAF
jgi:subtilase-type serine protease